MKKKAKSTVTSLEALRLERLSDPKRADYALKLAIKEYEEDGDVDVLLDTLRLVAKAQGSIAELARRTSLSRPTLHEALSPNGNPRLRTFQSILGSLGLRMSFKPAPHQPLAQ